MLVLTRRSGESIVIGEVIRIRVLHASGSRVRIGIEAPADIRIIRERAEAVAPLPSRTPSMLRDGIARSVAVCTQTEAALPAGVELQAPVD